MAKIKETGAVTATISHVGVQVIKKNIPLSSAIVVIGIVTSTNALFQRSFPTTEAANSWLTTGAAADVTVERIESVATFGA